MSDVKLFKTRHDLNQKVRGHVVALVNQQLADTFDLLSQVKQAHWNVKGPNFIALHELFDSFAGHLTSAVDDIAERATALGGVALGTARLAAKHSRLPEYPLEAVNGEAHLNALAERFAALAASTRSAIDQAAKLDDADTADLFTGISRQLDKDLWFIESHLQG